MNLLLEVPGERRARLVFVLAIVLGVALSPFADALLERWMPSTTLVQSGTTPTDGATWDLRNMWY